jgi:hypothetical protein
MLILQIAAGILLGGYIYHWTARAYKNIKGYGDMWSVFTEAALLAAGIAYLIWCTWKNPLNPEWHSLSFLNPFR